MCQSATLCRMIFPAVGTAPAVCMMCFPLAPAFSDYSRDPRPSGAGGHRSVARESIAALFSKCKEGSLPRFVHSLPFETQNAILAEGEQLVQGYVVDTSQLESKRRRLACQIIRLVVWAQAYRATGRKTHP